MTKKTSPKEGSKQTKASRQKSPSAGRKKDRPSAKRSPKKKTATQAIKEYLQDHPTAKNKEVVTALSKQGIVVDEYLPATVKSRLKKGRKPAAKKDEDAEQGPPTVFLQTPLYTDFLNDLTRAKTHSATIKNFRILVARLNRIVEILDVLKDDDWEITMLPDHETLMFSAKHALATTAAQARARLNKLGIKPKEVEIVIGG